ncbi:MAG TPA: hypothetical protein VGK20_19140 [Candidatus Binatia bacterium]|jgi:D-serine deaminase-like pyridoxal phosphate-dependent protein
MKSPSPTPSASDIAGSPNSVLIGIAGSRQRLVTPCLVLDLDALALGSAVECVVPHCDPTVNLYDHFHCVRGDDMADVWPVDVRGAA